MTAIPQMSLKTVSKLLYTPALREGFAVEVRQPVTSFYAVSSGW